MSKSPNSPPTVSPATAPRRHYTKSRRASKVAALSTRRFLPKYELFDRRKPVPSPTLPLISPNR
jgi:hypothetical protein